MVMKLAKQCLNCLDHINYVPIYSKYTMLPQAFMKHGFLCEILMDLHGVFMWDAMGGPIRLRYLLQV